MYVVPRRDRRPFFAIVYSSLVDHSVPWAIHDKLFFLPGGGIPDRGLRLRSRGMIDDKVEDEIRGPRLSFIFYFIDGYGTHVKDIMIYPRGQKIVFQVAAGASYTSNQASSFDQITRRGMRITLVDFFQYVNIIGSINVYRRFRSHRVHNNGRPSCASILENGTTMLLIYIRISRVHDALTFREIWLSGNGITRN